MSKVIAFIKSRPTETWLGLWTAIVSVLTALGIDISEPLVAAVSAVIGWIVTFVASQSETLGPQ